MFTLLFCCILGLLAVVFLVLALIRGDEISDLKLNLRYAQASRDEWTTLYNQARAEATKKANDFQEALLEIEILKGKLADTERTAAAMAQSRDMTIADASVKNAEHISAILKMEDELKESERKSSDWQASEDKVRKLLDAANAQVKYLDRKLADVRNAMIDTNSA